MTEKISLFDLYHQDRKDEILKILENAISQKAENAGEHEYCFDVNEEYRSSNYAFSILFIFISHGDENLARALWKAGADEKRKDTAGAIPFVAAVECCNRALAKEMLEKMIADGGAGEFLDRYDEGHLYSPFEFLCSQASYLVELALKAGANPLAPRPMTRFTPLSDAARWGEAERVKLMLEYIPASADKELLEKAIEMAETPEIADMISEKLKQM